MLITTCRLYDSYGDANRVILMLEAAAQPLSETSLISNNSDAWYSAERTDNVVPLRKDGASSKSHGKFKGATVGAATAATAASLVTILALPGVGTVIGAGWLVAFLGSRAVGGATGGLLGALTNAGINEEDAQVLVERVPVAERWSLRGLRRAKCRGSRPSWTSPL